MHIIEHQMAHNGRALPGAKNTEHPQTVIKKKKQQSLELRFGIHQKCLPNRNAPWPGPKTISRSHSQNRKIPKITKQTKK
jgi:hypothetical protein